MLRRNMLRGDKGSLYFYLERIGGFRQSATIEHEIKGAVEDMSPEQAANVAEAFLRVRKQLASVPASAVDAEVIEVRDFPVLPSATAIEPGVSALSYLKPLVDVPEGAVRAAPAVRVGRREEM